jgi:hypothetical protein
LRSGSTSANYLVSSQSFRTPCFIRPLAWGSLLAIDGNEVLKVMDLLAQLLRLENRLARSSGEPTDFCVRSFEPRRTQGHTLF